jgi:hypothetical protein
MFSYNNNLQCQQNAEEAAFSPEITPLCCVLFNSKTVKVYLSIERTCYKILF